jgi:hypothetical protein
MNRNLLFTGSILVVGLVYLAMALQMPRGTIAYPGPGFYPSVVGVFLVLTAAYCFGRAVLQAWTERSAEAPRPPDEAGATKPTLQLLGLLVLYAGALPYLGFVPAIFAFLLLAMRTFGYRNWARSVLVTAIIVAISWVTFVYWLKVPLPRGLLDDYM